MKLPKNLIKKHIAVSKEIQAWVDSKVWVGMDVEFLEGKYKGRKSRVTGVFWENDLQGHDDSHSIQVVAYPYSLRYPEELIGSTCHSRVYGSFSKYFKVWKP